MTSQMKSNYKNWIVVHTPLRIQTSAARFWSVVWWLQSACMLLWCKKKLGVLRTYSANSCFQLRCSITVTTWIYWCPFQCIILCESQNTVIIIFPTDLATFNFQICREAECQYSIDAFYFLDCNNAFMFHHQ